MTHSAEIDAPACRACYAATLTPDERDRFNAEPATSCIYLCPKHAEVIDSATRGLLSAMFIRKPSALPPKFTRVTPPEETEQETADWYDTHDAITGRVIPPEVSAP